ncbi:MAG: hypothetical protein ACOYCD_04855 [Kiritimatiellia bacterium]
MKPLISITPSDKPAEREKQISADFSPPCASFLANPTLLATRIRHHVKKYLTIARSKAIFSGKKWKSNSTVMWWLFLGISLRLLILIVYFSKKESANENAGFSGYCGVVTRGCNRIVILHSGLRDHQGSLNAVPAARYTGAGN